jgi:DNA-binding GntR family transcriptional regulator
VIFHNRISNGTSSKEFRAFADNVYESLRSDILTCHFAPGDDARTDLAERYAVTANQCAGLLRLERGIVTVTPRQGYRVNRSRWPMRATCCDSVLRWSRLA